jgi:outer membrane immunogenic protein
VFAGDRGGDHPADRNQGAFNADPLSGWICAAGNPGYVPAWVVLAGAFAMTFARFGFAAILIAMTAPAAAQTTDELKARIAALEKENAKLHQELTSRRAPSAPRRADAHASNGLASTAISAPADRRIAAAYAAVPPLLGSWTGFYVGGNFGLSIGKNATDSLYTNQIGPQSIRRLETFNLSPQGGLAGLQAGFNWQASRHFVLGVEADYQWTNAGDTGCVLTCTDPVTRAGGLLYKQTLSSFGTLRGRAGWTNGPSLFYLTGGVAYGQFDTDLTYTQAVIGHLTNTREAKSGWTAGGGLETQITGNLTAKAEYLYIDFGTTGGQAIFDNSGGAGANLNIYDFSSHLHDHVFRAGLNYKFGDPIYVAAQNAAGSVPVPASDWAGFYVGANGGIALGRNPSNFFNLAPDGVTVTNDSKVNINPVGGFVGGQAGYLAKISPNWLVGVEADLQSSHLHDPTTCFGICASSQATGGVGGFFGLPGIGINSMSQREDWFATLRARAGWTNGATLFYATGGAALGRIVTDVNLIGGTLSPYNVKAQGAASIEATNWGWTIGGGIETALAANWSLKSEYLYMDLGRVGGTVLRNGGVEVITVSSQVRNHLFRLGVNYRTDWGDVIGWN